MIDNTYKIPYSKVHLWKSLWAAGVMELIPDDDEVLDGPLAAGCKHLEEP